MGDPLATATKGFFQCNGVCMDVCSIIHDGFMTAASNLAPGECTFYADRIDDVKIHIGRSDSNDSLTGNNVIELKILKTAFTNRNEYRQQCLNIIEHIRQVIIESDLDFKE